VFPRNVFLLSRARIQAERFIHAGALNGFRFEGVRGFSTRASKGFVFPVKFDRKRRAIRDRSLSSSKAPNVKTSYFAIEDF
jgi:hypothetical protein